MDSCCPKCGKSAYVAQGVLFLRGHMQNFILPYLLCDACRIFHADRKKLKERAQDFCPQERTHCRICRQIRIFLSELEVYWLKRGYLTYRPRHRPVH